MSIRVARKRADAYQHGDLRRALVQAGLKLLTEEGASGLSLRAAAELAGVSHAAPYRHFRDKDALVAAIAEEGFHLLTRFMRDEIEAAGSTDVLPRFRAAGRGYVMFAVQHPAYFRTIFGCALWPRDAGGKGSRRDGKPGGELPASLRAAGDEAYRVLRAIVEEGLARGQLGGGNVDQVSLAAWSLVHGLGMLIIDGQLAEVAASPAAVRDLTDTLGRMLERGLCG
jgi:AcrR family transcriptional regulator